MRGTPALKFLLLLIKGIFEVILLVVIEKNTRIELQGNETKCSQLFHNSDKLMIKKMQNT